jgi:hypothetical protein
MKIQRHRGVGAVMFGMSRADVARAMGVTPERGRRNEFSATEHDSFAACSMFVYYDPDDRAIAAEVGRGVKLEFEGYDLFAHPASAVRAWASRMDPLLEPRDGFTSVALGLSMYAPEIDDDDLTEEERALPAEGFLVFQPGYYEDERRRIEARRATKRNGAAPTSVAAPFPFGTSPQAANVGGVARGGGSATVGPGAVGSAAVAALVCAPHQITSSGPSAATLPRVDAPAFRIGSSNRAHLIVSPSRREFPGDADYWDGNWLYATITIAAGAFRGSFEAVPVVGRHRASEVADLGEDLRPTLSQLGAVALLLGVSVGSLPRPTSMMSKEAMVSERGSVSPSEGASLRARKRLSERGSVSPTTQRASP